MAVLGEPSRPRVIVAVPAGSVLGPQLGRCRVEAIPQRPLERGQREPWCLSVGEVEPVLMLLDDAGVAWALALVLGDEELDTDREPVDVSYLVAAPEDLDFLFDVVSDPLDAVAQRLLIDIELQALAPYRTGSTAPRARTARAR